MGHPDELRYHRHFLVAAVVLCGAFFILLGFWPRRAPLPMDPATQPFRRHLVLSKERLLHWASILEAIHEASPATESELRWMVVAGLRDLQTEQAWEEKVLYPAVEHWGRSQHVAAPFRREHRIIDRWIDELEDLAGEPFSDHNAFCARGDRLLGLLEAHYEVEETVLLPVLDRTMTPEQFRREIATTMDFD